MASLTGSAAADIVDVIEAAELSQDVTVELAWNSSSRLDDLEALVSPLVVVRPVSRGSQMANRGARFHDIELAIELHSKLAAANPGEHANAHGNTEIDANVVLGEEIDEVLRAGGPYGCGNAQWVESQQIVEVSSDNMEAMRVFTSVLRVRLRAMKGAST
jgi:hypothetical protein